MTFTATPAAKAIEAALAHPRATMLTVELDRLRMEARAVVRVYLPGPHRAMHLRALEVRQRAILAEVRRHLGTTSPSDSRLPVSVRGRWQPEL